MRNSILFICAATLIPPPAILAQNLSVGVLAGGSLTKSFPTDSLPGDPLGSIFYSQSRDYLAGGTVEIRLPASFSLEVDGIFRKLHLTMAGLEPNGALNSVSPSPVITWEFPILAKYHFERGTVRPFVEAGPSFRTAGNLNGANPSHSGITAGAGVEMRVRGFAIAPAIRYTRWQADGKAIEGLQTAPDQVELLAEFSRAFQSESPSANATGRRISLGATVGVSLTDDYQYQAPVVLGGVTQTLRTGVHDAIAGPMAEFGTANWSVEVGAVYRSLRQNVILTSSSMPGAGTETGHLSTWEFPVLGKYKLPLAPSARPFVEAGPSFRIPWSVSNFGIAIGIGVQTQLGKLKISPETRYTRWQRDGQGTGVDQLELLFGFAL
jgi:hypothetical protein